jgi:hypothetical protein
MQPPSTTWLFLTEQITPFAVIIAVLSFVMIVLYLSARNRRLHLTKARSGTTVETFVYTMVERGYDPEISGIVYQYLQQRQNVHFPIEPTDRLDEDLGLDLVEVDETTRDVLKLTQRLYRPGLRHSPIISVIDLVRFIQASPRIALDRAA